MATEVKLKKWGNSMGIILPKEVLKEKHLKENDVILIEIVKKADLGDVFGSLKMKRSAQEMKDMVRKGWE